MNVLVLSTIELFGFQLMTCLGEAGYQVHLCNDCQLSIADRLSRHCTKHVCKSRRFLTEPTPELADFINDYCRNNRITVVLPADMRCTLAVSAISDQITQARIGALPDLQTIDLLHNKWNFYKFLNEHDLPAPQSYMLESMDDIDGIGIEYPVIVKPPNGENGQGICRIDSPEQLHQYVQNAEPGEALPLLVQKFIHGPDIDISILADHGKLLAWTIQQRDTHNPGTIHFLEHPEVFRIAKAIAEYANYTGVAHLDLRIDEQTRQVYVIELNPRFWGSLLWSLWAGVNFPHHLIRMTMGQELDGPVIGEPGPCTHSGLAFGQLFTALLHGRARPVGLSPSSINAWHTNHTDPLPQVYYKIADYFRKMTG